MKARMEYNGIQNQEKFVVKPALVPHESKIKMKLYVYIYVSYIHMCIYYIYLSYRLVYVEE